MKRSSSAPGSKPVLPNPGQADPRGNSFSGQILRHMGPTVTAIMVDAAFFLKRARHIFGDLLPQQAARKLGTVRDGPFVPASFELPNPAARETL